MKVSARLLQYLPILLLSFASALMSLASTHAQTLSFNLLHTFTGPPDGISPGGSIGNPSAGPLLDAKGNLFGTTSSGGDINCPGEGFGCGTVFKVDKSGQYSILYTFLGGADGDLPLASLSEDAAGNLYGTTVGPNGNAATVFKLTQSGQKTILHTFSDGADGAGPDTTPILDAAGNLYGTTPFGGDSQCGVNGDACGVIYKVDAHGKFSVFHTFRTIAGGMRPEGGLGMDAAGTIYGSTAFGGIKCPESNQLGCGTVFKIEPRGKFTVLYRFTGKADGTGPINATADAAGNVYGITAAAGDFSCYAPYGCGTIFKIDTAGKFSALFTFTSKVIKNPEFNFLVLDSKRNLYVTTVFGLPGTGGQLFELDTNGKFTTLFNFADYGNNDGEGLNTNTITIGKNGDFYGTMKLLGDSSCGGSHSGCGTVFKLTPKRN